MCLDVENNFAIQFDLTAWTIEVENIDKRFDKWFPDFNDRLPIKIK